MYLSFMLPKSLFCAPSLHLGSSLEEMGGKKRKEKKSKVKKREEEKRKEKKREKRSKTKDYISNRVSRILFFSFLNLNWTV